jgi:low affinity Fe/Cu permease
VQEAGLFDRVATVVGAQVSRAWFFAVCVLSIVVWAITGPLFAFNETWQLVINTGTTIITFLLVALLQNTQDRSTKAITHKLDALLDGVARILQDESDHQECVAELRRMAGVEMEPSK